MKNKYSHITLGERAVIQTELQEGLCPAFIASSLGRHRSSISRELARNEWKAGPHASSVRPSLVAGGYSCEQANIRAAKLAVVPRVQRKLVPGNSLWDQVRDGLKQGLSPEQISGTLSRMNEPIRLSHETIYQTIYVMPKGQLRTDTISPLRFGHNKRRPSGARPLGERSYKGPGKSFPGGHIR